ncbi:MAG: chitin disaccharide deacetylase [Anaerolineales bacterium]|nr:MAG: chitin disaccharide deacetylase [Anaerolineales bacterium]
MRWRSEQRKGMKRLIVNSDDYGRTPDISRGIREAHLNGVVTSTTCMMNIPTTAEDVKVALQETPNLGMGVHLVLTMGKPLSPREAVVSTVDENGNFFKYTPFIENIPNLNLDEVKLEWRAQIERFIATAGRKPTHLDSHHHSSYFSPELFRGMLELAREYDCAVRYPFTDISSEIEETSKHAPALMQEFKPRHPDVFIVDFYDDGATHEHLLEILGGIQEGTNELMCHPGHVDEAFAQESVYNFQRARELKILTDPATKNAIRANDIELISFADL